VNEIPDIAGRCRPNWWSLARRRETQDMKIQPLAGKKVAILVTDGFEQDELFSPLEALRKAGADVQVVSPSKESKIRGWKHADWGKK
jgi:hypothetical protein